MTPEKGKNRATKTPFARGGGDNCEVDPLKVKLPESWPPKAGTIYSDEEIESIKLAAKTEGMYAGQETGIYWAVASLTGKFIHRNHLHGLSNELYELFWGGVKRIKQEAELRGRIDELRKVPFSVQIGTRLMWLERQLKELEGKK